MKVTSIKRTGVSSSKIDAILNKSKYRTVVEQYLLDTKQIEESVSSKGIKKMEMGKFMEPIIKDLVERTLDVKLTVDKNRYKHDTWDTFTIEFDALDLANDVIYEFKNTERDEKSIYNTYYPQVQFAMMMSNFNNARICYLRNGWELGFIDVKRDDNFIEHMVRAGLYYSNCLVNKKQPDPDYINCITNNINFYRTEDSTLRGVGVNLELPNNDIQKLYQWADIKNNISKLEREEDTYKTYFADKYGKYSDGSITFSNVETEREGGYDMHAFIKDHPHIDLRPYKKENTKYSRQTLRVRKAKDEVKIAEIDTEDIV
jgi:predicted phage-related endonuclease